MKRAESDAVFDGYIRFLLDAEGAYANDAEDRGGETHFGLSERFMSSIGRSAKGMTHEQAIEVYRRYFWQGSRAHEMPPFVGWCMADAQVQHPPKAAAQMVQQGVGVEPDGIIGPATLAAAQGVDTRLFWRRYRLARIRYYGDIVRSDETQMAFLDGWHDRLHKLAEALVFEGLAEPAAKPSIVKSPAAKATGLGALAALFVGALQFVGITPDSIGEWLTGIGAPAGLAATAVAWIARLNLNRT